MIDGLLSDGLAVRTSDSTVLEQQDDGTANGLIEHEANLSNPAAPASRSSTVWQSGDSGAGLRDGFILLASHNGAGASCEVYPVPNAGHDVPAHLRC